MRKAGKFNQQGLIFVVVVEKTSLFRGLFFVLFFILSQNKNTFLKQFGKTSCF